MKTNKYNNMIPVFQCDFSLVSDNNFKLLRFGELIKVQEYCLKIYRIITIFHTTLLQISLRITDFCSKITHFSNNL